MLLPKPKYCFVYDLKLIGHINYLFRTLYCLQNLYQPQCDDAVQFVLRIQNKLGIFVCLLFKRTVLAYFVFLKLKLQQPNILIIVVSIVHVRLVKKYPCTRIIRFFSRFPAENVCPIIFKCTLFCCTGFHKKQQLLKSNN